MSQLIIELTEIRKIIESDWDDTSIRIKLGEFLIQKAVEKDEGISELLNVKFISENKDLEFEKYINVRCCRGRF